MLSDATWHGLPLHIAKLEGRSDKFDKLHESLIAQWGGTLVRRHTGNLDIRTLREADRVADAIVDRLLERYPQPDMGQSDMVAAPDWLS